MKRVLKAIVLGGIAFAMACIIPLNANQVRASEGEIKEEKGIEAQVVVPESEVYATVTRSAYNGLVDGDGVRLRKTPSSTGTIVALMYDGEKVFVVPNESPRLTWCSSITFLCSPIVTVYFISATNNLLLICSIDFLINSSLSNSTLYAYLWLI